MSEAFTDGILFFIAVQLLAASVLHFWERQSQRSLFLALLCLVNGLWYFYFIFHQIWKQHIILGIVIGPDKFFFLPPLFLLYMLTMYRKTVPRATCVKHLVPPTLLLAASLIIRFYFPDQWISFYHPEYPFPLMFLIVLGYFGYYFLLSKVVLRQELRPALLPKVYRRVRLFFIAIYLFFFLTPLIDIARSWVDSQVLPYRFEERYPVAYTILDYLEDLIYGYYFIWSYLLSFYALTELRYVRRLLLPKNTVLSQNLRTEQKRMEQLLHEVLVEQNLFRHADLSAVSFAEAYGLNRQQLLEYLEVTQQTSFTNYVNRLRVNEFKAQVQQANKNHLDLVGLAQECGFQSKSTFFRVFKDFEGITPNAYRKRVLSDTTSQ